MIRHWPYIAALLLAVPVAAATVQQDFDAAQAQLDAQDYVGARNAFTALLARFPPGSNGKAASLVRVKLGSALIATNEPEAAIPLLEQALPNLKPATPLEAEVEAMARFDLGRAREATGAVDSAARDYRAALALNAYRAGSPMNIAMQAGLARTLIWSHPAEARQLLDGLLALPPVQLSGDSRALVLTLRGRVELNNGDPAAAKGWFEQAASAAGGSQTQKVNIADVRIRGDLALANHALGDKNALAKGMHYAGADGDIPALFSSVAAMPLPACAPLTGLTPDTFAVIEFAVGNDGRVSGVTPIYARRGTGMGKAGGDDQGPEVLFAEAVRDWYWPANAVQKLDGFWRQAIRVELRCLTQRQADNPVYASLGSDFAAWYSQLGIAPMPDVEGNDATILPADRAELARREAAYGASSPQLLQPLNALANNGAAPAAERVAAANRWETLFLQTAPDPQLRLAMQVWKTMMLASTEQSSESAHRQVVRSLMPLVQQADADGLGDTRTGMAARLLLANYLMMTGANAKAQPLYQAVAAAPESLLPANDPMRLQALLYMADMAARKGDLASASDAISATGLAPEQCALIDVRPQRINGTVSEQSFPAMAKSWGSSGYVKTGFDISTDGRPQNVRTVISSPPFIFGPETEKAIAKFRYSPVFRPGNTVGCSAQTQSVRFRAAAGY